VFHDHKLALLVVPYAFAMLLLLTKNWQHSFLRVQKAKIYDSKG
jgi:hypothetical protein